MKSSPSQITPLSRKKEVSRKDNQIALIPEKELPKNTPSNSNNNKKRNYPAIEKFVDNSKSVIIIGDSMIKHLNGWEMSKKINNSGCQIYLTHFVGAKTICMKYHTQPSLKKCAKPLHSSSWH